MNERIRQLVLQAGIELPNNVVDGVNGPGIVSEKDKLAEFAELIVRECMKLNSKELSITAIERLLPLYREHFGVEE
jgi:hypothetical protein